MCQSLPYMDLKLGKDFTIYKTLNTPDDFEIGFVTEVDLKSPEEVRKELTYFIFCLEIFVFLKINLLII